MISATAETAGANASTRKSIHLRLGLWLAVAVVFATQVALVFWAGDPKPIPPENPVAAPVIRLTAEGADELLALEDQTLFVLPHRDNFSGDAWLKFIPQRFTPTNWTEPTRPLELPMEQLGSAFAVYMQTNVPPRFQPELNSLGAVEEPAPKDPISVPSTLRIEGDLARLRLLTPVDLPPQTNSDLLTNTVVQLVVDAQGHPFSSIIWSSCGDTEHADAAALAFAKSVRFEPAQAAALGTVPPDKMTMGRLIFEWQTVPPIPTNAPPASP